MRVLMSDNGAAVRGPVGSYTGTGSDQDIITGISPEFVRIYREDNAYQIWSDGSKTQGAAEFTAGQNIMLRGIKVLSGGVSLIDGGFRVGSHDAVNEAGMVYYYEVR